MDARRLLPLVGGHLARAKAFEQLLYQEKRQGRGELQIRLDHIAKYTHTSKRSVSNYLQWLSERAFIRIRKVWRGSACILYVRLLIRPLERWLFRERSRRVHGAFTGGSRYTKENTYPDTNKNTHTVAVAPDQADCSDDALPEKALTPQSPPSPSVVHSRLQGSVSGAKDRMDKKKQDRRGQSMSGHNAAVVWNELLREWGIEPFLINKTTIPHVKRVLKWLKPDDLEHFRERLDTAIEWWSMNRQNYPNHKNVPAHPWIMFRYKELAFGYVRPEKPKPVAPVAPNPFPVQKPQKPKTLLEKLQTPKKVYKGLMNPGEGED